MTNDNRQNRVFFRFIFISLTIVDYIANTTFSNNISIKKILVDYYFLWFIRYFPIVCILFVCSVLLEKHFKSVILSETFHYFIHWQLTLIWIPTIITATDMFIFCGNPQACFWSNKLTYVDDDYYIVDIFLLFYFVFSYQLGMRLLSRFGNDDIPGWAAEPEIIREKPKLLVDWGTILLCATLILLPNFLFFMPFFWTSDWAIYYAL
jgi:hypothetical protein